MTEIIYREAIGKFNTKVERALQVFDLYGMGIFIPHVILEIHEFVEECIKEINLKEKIK